MSGIRVRLPRDVEESLMRMLEDIIKTRYGEAMTASLKSYIDTRCEGKKITELLLYEPLKLVDVTAEFLGGSRDTAVQFILSLLKSIYERIKEAPEIDIERVAERLARGEDEDFRNLILELAYKVKMKTLQPMF